MVLFVCSVHVNMCMHHGAYVFICTQRSEANISVFLYCFLSHFLRQSLTELGASMAAYIPSNPPVSTLHSAGITGKHGHAQVFA